MPPPENRHHVSQEPALLAGDSQLCPHPAVVILLWLFLAIALQAMHVEAMLLTGVFLTIIALKVSAVRLYALLRRTRWIMVSLLLIYGYVAPGESIWAQAGIFSPTQQGLADGLLQLCRLASALAGLSIVLGMLPLRHILAGLYVLAYPLRYFGLPRERIAVRLALTLHYAETAMLDTASGWRSSIGNMLIPAEIKQQEIELQVIPVNLRDALIVLAGCALLALALL
jgi:energy-coupling factor transporter transmembrane protein EcfT